MPFYHAPARYRIALNEERGVRAIAQYVNRENLR